VVQGGAGRRWERENAPSISNGSSSSNSKQQQSRIGTMVALVPVPVPVGDEMVLMPEASSSPLRLGLGSRLTAVSDPGDGGQANQPLLPLALVDGHVAIMIELLLRLQGLRQL